MYNREEQNKGKRERQAEIQKEKMKESRKTD